MTGKLLIASVGVFAAAGLVVGCSGPSKANIELRKENQQLQAQIDQLKRQREGDLQRIAGLEAPTTRPALPQVRLDRLYTAHGLSFGKLTGGYKNDPLSTYDDGVAVYVVPTDNDGQTLKAAGSFDVFVYDLALPNRPLVASKRFGLEEAKRNWYGQAMQYNYVLKVPFEQHPEHRQLLVRVEFTDELTGRKIVAERQVTLRDSSAGASAAS